MDRTICPECRALAEECCGNEARAEVLRLKRKIVKLHSEIARLRTSPSNAAPIGSFAEDA